MQLETCQLKKVWEQASAYDQALQLDKIVGCYDSIRNCVYRPPTLLALMTPVTHPQPQQRRIQRRWKQNIRTRYSGLAVDSRQT